MSSSEPLSWLPPQLELVALRLARADELAFQIGGIASEWSLNSPLTLQEVRCGQEMELRVKAIRPVPPVTSLLFSEAANHLRAALDNVVWHLVEQINPNLTAFAARLVAMPIQKGPEALTGWTERVVKAKISAFGPTTTLGKRLRQLQPFEDVHSRIGSMSEDLAALIGQDVEYAHPLTLLQGYSNADKHRAVQLASARSFQSDDQTPFLTQNHGHQELRVGDVMARGRVGRPVFVESQTAAMIQRPEPFTAWVNPVFELNDMRKYLSETAIPILLTGIALPTGLPPQIALGDTGKCSHQLIAEGQWEDAKQRLVEPMKARLIQAEARDVAIPEVVIEDIGW